MKYNNKIINVSNKKEIIKNLFNDVSENYDKMNDLMSFGLHRVWKKDMISELKNEKAEVILDLAGGTGDIALKLASIYTGSLIIIYDLSINMMTETNKNIAKYKDQIKYVNGSAEEIALRSNSIDFITLSFGLRKR